MKELVESVVLLRSFGYFNDQEPIDSVLFGFCEGKKGQNSRILIWLYPHPLNSWFAGFCIYGDNAILESCWEFFWVLCIGGASRLRSKRW